MRFVRRLASACVIAAALASAAATTDVFAADPPVSETEKSAARQLYREGAQLQQDGKYADALDKLERAQRVYPAPTNLLRMAQCQAMLGRLVESLASYRAVVNFEMPAGAPPPFRQAVDEAKAEMPQVEPRVPRVKVDVTPANAPGLEVRLDGKPINAALVGEPLPLDPGTHAIAVSAPGYASDEQSVTVKERESKALAFTLRADASPMAAAPPPIPSSSTADEPPPPPPIAGSGRTTAAATRTRTSLLLGVRLGADVPGGDVQKNKSISDSAGPGAAAGIEGGIRLFDHFYFGLFVEAAGYGQGNSSASLLNVPSGPDVTSNGTGTFGGVDLAWISNAHKIGAMLDVGLGYRSLTIDTQLTSSGGLSQDIKTTYGGGELLFGGGMFIKASSWLRIVPKITIGVGPFTKRTTECSTGASGAPPEATDCATLTSQTFGTSDQAGHAFVFLGISGFYNLDLK